MTDFDLTDTILANSDQLNADDLMGGPQTFTITDVTKGTAEQRAFIHLTELPGKTYRPSKTMRRVLVAAWGVKGADYIGHRVTLYRDPDVKYGGQNVGGIKISHMTGISKPLSLMLAATQSTKARHTVDPLPDNAPAATPEPTFDDVAGCTDRDALKAMWRASGKERQSQIQARVAELDAPTEEPS